MGKEVFNNEDKKHLNIVSKVVSVFAKIFSVFSLVGGIMGAICFLTIVIVMPNVTVNTSNNTVKVFNKETTYKLTDGKIYIDGKEIGKYSEIDKVRIERVLSLNKALLVVVPAYYLLTVTILCIVANRLFKNINKVFKSINQSNTPFLWENVSMLDMAFVELIIVLIIPYFINGINEILYSGNGHQVYSLNVILVLFITRAAIIMYKYGCSLETKGNKKTVKE